MARRYGFGQGQDALEALAEDLKFLADAQPESRARRRNPPQILPRRLPGGKVVEEVSSAEAPNAIKDEIARVQTIFENPDAYPKFELLSIKDKMQPNKVYYSIRFFEKLKSEKNQDLTHPFYSSDYTKDEYLQVVTMPSGDTVQTRAGIGSTIQNATVMTVETPIPRQRNLVVYPLDARYASYPYSNEIYTPFQTPPLVEMVTQRMIEDDLFQRFLKEYEDLFDSDAPELEAIKSDLKTVTRKLNRYANDFSDESKAILTDEAKLTRVGMLLNLFIEFLNRENSLTTPITTLDLIDTLLDPTARPQEPVLAVDTLPTAGYLLKVNGLRKAFLFTKLVVDKEIAQSFSRNIHALPSILMKGRSSTTKSQKDAFSWIETYGKLHPEQMHWYRTKALILNFDRKQPYDRSMISINPRKVEIESGDDYIDLSICLAKQGFGSVFFYYDRASNTYYECDLSLVISTDVNESITGLLSDAQMTFKYLDLAQMEMITAASHVFRANEVFLQTWSRMKIRFSQYRVLEAALKVLAQIEKTWNTSIDSMSLSEAVDRATKDPEQSKFIRALLGTQMGSQLYRTGIEQHILKFKEEALKQEIPRERVDRLIGVIISGQASRYVFMASMLSGIAHQLLASMRVMRSTPAATRLLVGMRFNILARLIAYSERRVIPAKQDKVIKVFVSAQKLGDDVMNKAILSKIGVLPSAVGPDAIFSVGKLYLFQTRQGVHYLTQVIYVTEATAVVKQIYEIGIDSQTHQSALDANLVATLSNRQFGYEATVTILKPLLDESKRNYLFFGFGTMATNEIQVYEETALLEMFAKREKAENPISIQRSKELREMVITGKPKLMMFPEYIYSVELSSSATEIVQETTRYDDQRILQEQLGLRSSYLDEN